MGIISLYLPLSQFALGAVACGIKGNCEYGKSETAVVSVAWIVLIAITFGLPLRSHT